MALLPCCSGAGSEGIHSEPSRGRMHCKMPPGGELAHCASTPHPAVVTAPLAFRPGGCLQSWLCCILEPWSLKVADLPASWLGAGDCW